MQYFAVTMWNGSETYALFPHKPPIYVDQRKVEYKAIIEVAAEVSLTSCINEWQRKYPQT